MARHFFMPELDINMVSFHFPKTLVGRIPLKSALVCINVDLKSDCGLLHRTGNASMHFGLCYLMCW